jgi:hypothetical protein
MKLHTRSGAVIQATASVLRRLPAQGKQTVERFVRDIVTRTEYEIIGLSCEIDTASAMLNPRFERLQDISTNNYEPQVTVYLPIFRLFSYKAQIGIMAHEFAHAVRASKLGCGWHEKMQSRYAAEERLADSIAVRWGFGDNIKALRIERRATVNPLLEARGPEIARRMLCKTRRQQAELRARFEVEPEK